MGPVNYLYTVIGDLNHRGKVQNLKAGPDPDHTGGILEINPNDGSAARNNPFLANASEMLHKYFAYGVRNSFGLAFDPVTGSLWDTENGPGSYDEVNMVRPGFNSGWIKTMGPVAANQDVTEQQLVDFPSYYYADPVFSWKDPVAVTDLEFLKSSKLGPE
jgi:glucose/arabinose dehydrogenase